MPGTVGPIVPQHRGRDDLDLVCEPSRNGLIVGRMDFGRPASYITAVSYQGLRGAAALARRLKRQEEADCWQTATARLQAAWFKSPQWGGTTNLYLGALAHVGGRPL